MTKRELLDRLNGMISTAEMGVKRQDLVTCDPVDPHSVCRYLYNDIYQLYIQISVTGEFKDD